MQSYHISSTDHFENQLKVFSELKANEEFLDVTLACEDITIQAHKSLLAASSTFFREIFNKTKHPSPFIFLKGIAASDLKEILNFVYTGEAKVDTKNINRFLESSTELKIMGIMTDDDPSQNDQDEANDSGPVLEIKMEANDEKMDDVDQKAKSDGIIYEKDGLSNDLKALDKELCKRIDVSKDEEGKRILKCKECDKVFTSMHKAKFHVEIHVSGFYHNCDVCGVTYKTRNSLNQHKYTKHTLMNK